jgi:hypothetical protein
MNQSIHDLATGSKVKQGGLAVNTNKVCRNRSSQTELSQSTSVCTLSDRAPMAVISFGSLALVSIIWMHLTPSLHLAVVQTLQALASIATIASIVWTLFGGVPGASISRSAGSGNAFKYLLLTLACGMLLSSLSPGLAAMTTLLCSIPKTVTAIQQYYGCNAGKEQVPTAEEYLFVPMDK